MSSISTVSRSIPPCLLRAWQQHEPELRGWFSYRLRDKERVADALQELFLKAMTQGSRFCTIADPRAWLFEVARHHLVDLQRKHKEWLPLPDDLHHEEPALAVVDELTGCLPRVLSELSEADRRILSCCDIEGMTQQAFATAQGITLAAAKSRLLRARIRLKEQLTHSCQVRLDAEGKVCCYTPRPALVPGEQDNLKQP
ncbi:MAG: sigma-70 family RNA polymerase sigma factor [Aeromonadaceae bacterium]